MKPFKMRERHDRGFVLLSSYLFLAVLAIFSLAFLSRSYFFLQATERNRNRIVAFNHAESGVDYALAQLAVDPDYAGSGGYTAAGENGGYSVQVCPPACDGLEEPDDPNIRLISATGFSPSDDTADRAYEARGILARAEVGGTGFEFAAFGDEELTINGTPEIDSYRASSGDYGSNGNVGSEGDIASDGEITLVGNAEINGDVSGASITVRGRNVEISGDTSNDTPNLNCEPGTTDVASSGALRVTRGTHALTAGTYHFDSISVSGNGQISASGPVVIYVDGDVSLAGNGIATASETPSDLIIIATGDEDISISGGSAFYGGVFAPHSEVRVSGTPDFYGAVIANDFQQSGTADFHYDTDLSDYDLPCSSVNFLSWQEQNTVLQAD